MLFQLLKMITKDYKNSDKTQNRNILQQQFQIIQYVGQFQILQFTQEEISNSTGLISFSHSFRLFL